MSRADRPRLHGRSAPAVVVGPGLDVAGGQFRAVRAVHVAYLWIICRGDFFGRIQAAGDGSFHVGRVGAKPDFAVLGGRVGDRFESSLWRRSSLKI